MSQRALRSRMARLLRPDPQPVLSLDEATPFDGSETLRSERQEAALSLADPDTHGYLLLVLKRTPGGYGEIKFHSHIQRPWFAAFRRVLGRIERAL